MINKKPYLKKAKYVDLLWRDVLNKQIYFISYIKKKYFGKRPISIIDAACGNGRLIFPLVKIIRFHCGPSSFHILVQVWGFLCSLPSLLQGMWP